MLPFRCLGFCGCLPYDCEILPLAFAILIRSSADDWYSFDPPSPQNMCMLNAVPPWGSVIVFPKPEESRLVFPDSPHAARVLWKFTCPKPNSNYQCGHYPIILEPLRKLVLSVYIIYIYYTYTHKLLFQLFRPK